MPVLLNDIARTGAGLPRPFAPRYRVLYRRQPAEVWIVERLEWITDDTGEPYWHTMLYSYRDSTLRWSAPAELFVRAPALWVEPPVMPWRPMELRDAEYDAEMAEWEPRYASWYREVGAPFKRSLG